MVVVNTAMVYVKILFLEAGIAALVPRWSDVICFLWFMVGVDRAGMWSRSGLAATHVQCCHVGVVPSLLCGSPRACVAAAAVADGNIASVIPWWGLQENSGAERWRWESRSTAWGLWTFPPGTGWRTNSLAQQVTASFKLTRFTYCWSFVPDYTIWNTHGLFFAFV